MKKKQHKQIELGHQHMLNSTQLSRVLVCVLPASQAAGGRAAAYVERRAYIELVQDKVKDQLSARLRKAYRRRAMSSSVSFQVRYRRTRL